MNKVISGFGLINRWFAAANFIPLLKNKILFWIRDSKVNVIFLANYCFCIILTKNWPVKREIFFVKKRNWLFVANRLNHAINQTEISCLLLVDMCHKLIVEIFKKWNKILILRVKIIMFRVDIWGLSVINTMQLMVTFEF